jgi:hypothetical protein
MHIKIDASGLYGRSNSDGAPPPRENQGNATKLGSASKPSEKQSSADGVIDLAKDDIFKREELTKDRSFTAIHITLPGHFGSHWASAQPHRDRLAE